MIHDFANYRVDFPDESSEPHNPTDWSLDIISMVIGMGFGIFTCLFALQVSRIQPASPIQDQAAAQPEAIEDRSVEFEFYEELKIYEVPVRNR